jgi:plastocyanin
MCAVVALTLSYGGEKQANAGGIVTESLAGGSLTPSALVTALVGGGVTTSNVTYVGANVAAGTFSGGAGIVGFDSGVILSTGDVANVVGPNQLDDVTTINGTAGDAQLTALSTFATFDAAVLEFDFTPQTDTAVFRFVFASDEYNEFVNTQFNDVFAFYVNGVNCALVPGTSTPISINTINNGNPLGTNPTNPTLYRNNDLQDGGTLNTEMDGLTVVLTCIAGVTPDATNHIKLAIADASDEEWDAVVFLQANSLVGSGPGDSDCNELINSIDALHALRRSANLPVTAQCIGNADVNCSGVINSVDALLILRFSAGLPITGLPPGCPPIGSGPPPTAAPTPTPSGTPAGLQVTMRDSGNGGFFDPAQFNVTAGQAFTVNLTNAGPDTAHNMRIAGNNNTFFDLDDMLSNPDFMEPPPAGTSTGTVSGTLTNPGTYDFQCDFHPEMVGTVTAN